MGGIVYFRLSAVFNKLTPKGVNTAPLLFYSGDGKIFGAMKCARPLDVAIGSRDIKAVEALLDKGANPNLVAAASGPAIKEAARIGNPDMVKLVHKRGGDVNGRDSVGGTALHASISECYDFNLKDQLAVVEYLLDNGARTDLKNSCDMTPLEWARQLQRPELERAIASAMGVDTLEELKPSRQQDGTYLLDIKFEDAHTSVKAVIPGLRDAYNYISKGEEGLDGQWIVKAAEMKLGAFALDDAQLTLTQGGKPVTGPVDPAKSYQLLLVPEHIWKQRAQAAADEKAAFDDKLDKGLPTDDKVKGLKPISFKKPKA
ncbi:MAG: ankyrin repeat domain-containing protein [Alphaproteobacteria bacterium]